jgi:hypothetical protein
MRAIFLHIAAVFVFLVMLAGCSTTAERPTAPVAGSPPAAVITAPAATAPTPVTLSVIAVGDIMLGTDYPENHLPDADGADLLTSMTPQLRQADITFGNFEGTFLDGGKPVKHCKSTKNCYLFRTPTAFVDRLVEAGFNVMSLANNHARDFGELGRNSSMDVLAGAGIRHSGREQDIASWLVNGLRVVMIAYAPFVGAHDPLNLAEAKATVAELALRHDVVMVSMHMGAEGEQATHVLFENEIFHGEDRGDSAAFARAMVDAGADLVIGHGPHVPRALELYKDRLIAYSLGNFCTYQGINVQGKSGLAPALKVTLDADGRFVDGQIISARQQRPLGPVPDPAQAAAQLIAELTAEDFPETDLAISAEGRVQRKSQLVATERVIVTPATATKQQVADDKSNADR